MLHLKRAPRRPYRDYCVSRVKLAATASARRFRVFQRLPKRPLEYEFRSSIFLSHRRLSDAAILRLVHKDAANFGSCVPPNNQNPLCLGKANNKRSLFTACSYCSHRPTRPLSPRTTLSGYLPLATFTKEQWHFVSYQTHSLSFRNLSLPFISIKRCALSRSRI